MRWMRRAALMHQHEAAMTTGRRFAKRTKDHSEEHVLDARTKAVLATIAREPRGRALDAYLLARERDKR